MRLILYTLRITVIKNLRHHIKGAKNGVSVRVRLLLSAVHLLRGGTAARRRYRSRIDNIELDK